jgi:hypothetical protein
VETDGGGGKDGKRVDDNLITDYQNQGLSEKELLKGKKQKGAHLSRPAAAAAAAAAAAVVGTGRSCIARGQRKGRL